MLDTGSGASTRQPRERNTHREIHLWSRCASFVLLAVTTLMLLPVAGIAQGKLDGAFDRLAADSFGDTVAAIEEIVAASPANARPASKTKIVMPTRVAASLLCVNLTLTNQSRSALPAMQPAADS